ncbi:aldo/keto reductase [Flavobacterium cyanobacteriorum]|uniref:Aldo/keto reductase n=1 Tax=Flavobacterium cyanobacteriorum TaxID=2022802 RepID=A0A255ZMF0_9FLAO|nr:aldo/keto reductase [Flavobacterium cyanobacteriorum]OYQ42656.1 aldo/keto reductase [Flavobacterium cyanobacteriorum]
MEYRNIGNSGLRLSAITFGAWAAGGWMWGGTERKDAVRAIRASFDEGVTSIDTAPIYGQGDSEEIVAEAIEGLGRDKVQIITKFGMRWNLAKGDLAMKSRNNRGEAIEVYKYAGRESIIKECKDSLRRLKTDYIDLYQIHWPDSTTPIQESMETVAELIKEGKVRYAGVCNYNTGQMKEADKYVNIISNQVPYSMIKREIEKTVVPFALENNKSIIAYSPLERGLLTGKMLPGHQFEEGDHRANLYYFRDENLEKVNSFLNSIKHLADDRQASLSQLVLRWTIEQPGITIALAGARNAIQSVQNAKAINVKLYPDEINFITAELNKLELVR